MIEKTKLKKKLPFETIDTFKNNENNKSWDKDNQAWWDWYVSLADNTDSNKKDGLIKIPEPVKTKYPSKDELKEQLSSPFNISKDNIKTLIFFSGLSKYDKRGFISKFIICFSFINCKSLDLLISIPTADKFSNKMNFL